MQKIVKNKNIQIVEYGFLHCKKDYENEISAKIVYIEEYFFNELEQFVLENKSEGVEFLKLSHKKHYGKILQAQQYVGVLESKNGTTLEILPKITNISEELQYSKESREKNISENKKLFLKMLKHLKKSPFKNINSANLQAQKNFPLLEIFITLFCSEISNLLKKGLKSEYNVKHKNSFFLKGKLLFQKHISKNFIHKEKFFIETDEFSQNRAENRVLKSTIELLLKKSKSQKNITQLQEYLFIFQDISESKNISLDFTKIKISRDMKEYEQPLRWAEIFLKNKHITPVSGSSLASSLLFNMNKVFEDYVAYCLKKSEKYLEVKTQITGKYLIEYPYNKFALKPDLQFITKEKIKIIADTKWKIVRNIKDISQADIYQMFAYAKKYEIHKIQLIYPKHKNHLKNQNEILKFEQLFFKYLNQNNNDNISLDILFFDIENKFF